MSRGSTGAFSPGGEVLAVALQHEVQVLAVEPAVDLRAVGIELSEEEQEFIGELFPLVRTPRAVKRLVNVHRILRASLPADEPAADCTTALLLLAVLTGYPELGAVLVERLMDSPRAGWTAHVDAAADAAPDFQAPMWQALEDDLRRVPAARMPEDIEPFVRWAPRVARFSFRASRVAVRDERPLG
jgi:hypothetical protein